MRWSKHCNDPAHGNERACKHSGWKRVVTPASVASVDQVDQQQGLLFFASELLSCVQSRKATAARSSKRGDAWWVRRDAT